jgi:hypothetical protein
VPENAVILAPGQKAVSQSATVLQPGQRAIDQRIIDVWYLYASAVAYGTGREDVRPQAEDVKRMISLYTANPEK